MTLVTDLAAQGYIQLQEDIDSFGVGNSLMRLYSQWYNLARADFSLGYNL